MTGTHPAAPAPSPGPVLRAVPRLAFEVRRTIATVTDRGVTPGYASTEVSLLSDASLELQRDLGPDRFGVLLALVMSAREEDGRLVVEGATDVVRTQTRWSRAKASRVIAQLEDAGFMQRHQARTGTGFDKSRCWLDPALYQTVERRLSVAATEVRTGSTERADTKPYTAPPTPGGTKRDSTPPGDTEPDTTPVRAGHPGEQIRDTRVLDHHHGDGDEDELHCSAGHADEPRRHGLTASDADLAALLPLNTPQVVGSSALAQLLPSSTPMSVEEVRHVPRDEIVSLLKSWRVFDAEQIVLTTPSNVLTAAVAAVTSRAGTIENPGGYLRNLLRRAAQGQAPTAKTSGTPTVSTALPRSDPHGTTGVPPSTPRTPAPPPPVEDDVIVDSAAVDDALSALAADVREALHAGVDQEVSATSWARGPLAAALRRNLLTERLQELGVLPRP